MKSFGIGHSIFEIYNQLENINYTLSWELPPADFKVKKDEILFSGIIREIDLESGQPYPPKFYVATKANLIRFSDSESASPEAVLRLYMPRIDIINSIQYYGLLLSAYGKSMEFIFPETTERNNWYNVLRKYCQVVLSNIHG